MNTPSTLNLLFSTLNVIDKTAGLWSISSTIECKQEFLGHDHVIECIAFAPSTSTPFIQELSAKELVFSLLIIHLWMGYPFFFFYYIAFSHAEM
ncbi:hypothetical protein HMI55_000587 [Coelomomyces lativittatus]|nr:hypothetical protein HMI55_000587 [Coelomomyces lativittatus]